MRIRRALLYVPGDSPRKIAKALTLDCDCICLDLEDAVATSQKAAARVGVAKALAELDFGRSERLVRISAVGSGFAQDDLAQVIAARPHGIVLPKIEDASQIQWLDKQISEAEGRYAWPAGEINIIAMVETARAVLSLPAICRASARLQAIIFGAEDLAQDIGATRTGDAWEMLYARSAVVLHAAAFGLQAIDMVYVAYHDGDGLRLEAEQGAQLGFAGKQAIHPSQIGPIQTAFSPSPEAIARARRLIQSFAEWQASGVGAFELDGEMVDAPVMRAAEQVIDKARAYGLAT